ncbi:hypothetical protein TNCV_1733351 [Trichonephila clavipes]|nr:hypothetical protein TNCV_1733351 [Trichonephila clavipes]
MSDEEPLDNACHVWSRIIMMKYGCGQALKGRPSNGCLWTDHSAVNGVEWYAQILNDAVQTQCAMLWFVMRLNHPSLTCAQFACPHETWCTEVDAIDHVGPSYPPASNCNISALQLFGFVQHDYRFP